MSWDLFWEIEARRVVITLSAGLLLGAVWVIVRLVRTPRR